MADLGHWVRKNRVARNWAQSELARRVGVDSGSVSRWERSCGTPSLAAFERMCVLFEESADAALGLPQPIRRRGRRAVAEATA
jgi:transcriptional regulator with XRE-family HTH domain